MVIKSFGFKCVWVGKGFLKTNTLRIIQNQIIQNVYLVIWIFSQVWVGKDFLETSTIRIIHSQITQWLTIY